MSTAAARRRRGLRARQAGVAGSLAAHLLLFGMLALGWRSPIRQPEEPAISLDLVRPFEQPAPRSPPAKPPPKRTAQAPAAATTLSPSLIQASPPAVTAAPAGPAVPPAPSGDARLSAALRRSLLGCANAQAGNLTEAERDACRHSLAQGARTAPYISNIPPEKREYYAALAESEQRMFQENMGGHGPGILCGGDVKQRLGLKFGPCKLLAPMSPWTPEADVQPPR